MNVHFESNNPFAEWAWRSFSISLNPKGSPSIYLNNISALLELIFQIYNELMSCSTYFSMKCVSISLSNRGYKRIQWIESWIVWFLVWNPFPPLSLPIWSSLSILFLVDVLSSSFLLAAILRNIIYFFSHNQSRTKIWLFSLFIAHLRFYYSFLTFATQLSPSSQQDNLRNN